VRSWSPEVEVPREAFVVMRDRETRGTYEAVVSLTDERVESATSVLDGSA